jgi:electron transport complex protein RnfE
VSEPTSHWYEATAPLWRNNMALVQFLGLCPLLAVTTTLVSGLALGLASAAVIVVTSTAIAALRPILAPRARVPMALLILAALVSALDLVTAAVLYDLHGTLGIFIPQIVVNTGLLAHAQNVASTRSVAYTFVSALAAGLGFLFVFLVLGALREIVGHGTLLAGIEMLGGESSRALAVSFGGSGVLIATLPPGAFFAMGLLLALRNRFARRSAKPDATKAPR